jgi:hypothetical protein
MASLDFMALTTWPIVEYNDFVALALLHDGRFDSGAADSGPAHLDLVAVGHKQDAIQFDGVPYLLGQLFDTNLVAHAGAELLPAYLKDCVHDATPDIIFETRFLRPTPLRSEDSWENGFSVYRQTEAA